MRASLSGRTEQAKALIYVRVLHQRAMEAQLVQRLELAVARLEKLNVALVQGSDVHKQVAPASHTAAAKPVVSAAAPAATATVAAPAVSSRPSAGTLQDFDHLLTTYVNPLKTLSSSFAQEVQTSTSHFVQAMQDAKGVIQASMTMQKPDMPGLQQLLAPVARSIMAATQQAEGRRNASFNALKLVAEALQALSWLAYTGPACGMSPPGQHVADCWQSAEFYSSKLLMEARSANPPQGSPDEWTAWVKAMKECVTELEAYVRRHYSQGLTWGTGAGSTAAGTAAAAPAPAPPPPRRPAGGPPPPPPPGPPPKPLSVEAIAGDSKQAAAKPSGEGNMSALFKELQQGEGITKSLRKVTDDMKTKNRPDRTGVVSIAAKAPPATANNSTGASRQTGPPRMEYDSDRKKWVVENQVGQKQLVLDDVQPQQGIYVYNCKDCVIQVKNKANAICVDGCVKTGVVFGDLISSCEVVNSRSLQLQCTGFVPTVSIEKTDGVQLYVGKKVTQAQDFQVVTAKCSEINVHVLPDDESDVSEPQEYPVPEQFISTFDKSGQLVTNAATHSGA